MKIVDCTCGCKGKIIDTADNVILSYSMHHDKKAKVFALRHGISTFVNHDEFFHNGRIVSEFHNEKTMKDFMKKVVKARVSILEDIIANLKGAIE